MFLGTTLSSSLTSRKDAEFTELFGDAKVILSSCFVIASMMTGLWWPTLTEAVPARVSMYLLPWTSKT